MEYIDKTSGMIAMDAIIEFDIDFTIEARKWKTVCG